MFKIKSTQGEKPGAQANSTCPHPRFHHAFFSARSSFPLLLQCQQTHLTKNTGVPEPEIRVQCLWLLWLLCVCCASVWGQKHRQKKDRETALASPSGLTCFHSPPPCSAFCTFEVHFILFLFREYFISFYNQTHIFKTVCPSPTPFKWKNYV